MHISAAQTRERPSAADLLSRELSGPGHGMPCTLVSLCEEGDELTSQEPVDPAQAGMHLVRARMNVHLESGGGGGGKATESPRSGRQFE